MRTHARTAIIGLALATWLPAKDVTITAPISAEVAPPTAKDPAIEALKKEQESLEIENKLEAERLVQAGIKAILNFAPVQLAVPDDVVVKHVNLALELETLSYALANR